MIPIYSTDTSDCDAPWVTRTPVTMMSDNSCPAMCVQAGGAANMQYVGLRAVGT